MNSLVLVVLAAAVAVAAAGPAPGPEPGPVGPVAPAAPGSPDQESQASEAVSKRGAARLTPVAGNSIVDNTVSSAPPQQLQQLQQQPAQQQLSYSSQQQPQAQPQQQPLYAPHPYSFVAPQPHPSFFQYQPALPALPALPPMSLLHSKYHAGPSKHVLQYVPQPYFQVPQYQAPVMYIIPQPQPQPQSHAHHGQQGQHGQQGEQGQQAQQAQPQHQPHYVMVLPAPQPAFQYYNHPQLALPPQQLFSFYPGPHHPQQPQPQQVQAPQAAHPQHAQHAQHAHQPQTRYYPEQQPQLVFQQGDDSAPHFVPKQGLQGLQGLQGPLQAAQNPVGLEAPAPPQYGARVPQPQQSYKTIIKA